MKNKKLIFAVVVAAAIVLAAVVGILSANKNSVNDMTPDGTEVLKPAKLPGKKELKDTGLGDVMQTDELNDNFLLTDYNIEGNSITYYYNKDLTSGEGRLTVTAHPEDGAEYTIDLPMGDKVEKVNIGEYEMTFYKRMIYFVPDEHTAIPSSIRENAEKGNVEIRYGNSTAELVNCQTMQWYDNGIAYTMESLGRNLDKEEMSRLVSDYLNNRK